MIPLGLPASTLTVLHQTLADSHAVHVAVYTTTMSGTKVSDLSWRLLDGQVNVDANATITRSCTLSLLDPNRTMSFDSDSPADGAMYLDRMIQVNYSVLLPDPLNEWVTIPVFTGPLSKMARTDDVVSLEAQGKEALAMGPVWIPATYKKGTRKIDVIRSVLGTRTGETKFSFPESTSRLPEDYSIGRDNTAWGVARHVAQSMGLQLFYDGRGTARLRAYPQASVFHFKENDGGTVMTKPQISYSSDIKNIVRVVGATPKGAKKPIEASYALPPNHPASPERLGRNGAPRYLLEKIENSSITSLGEASHIAEITLRNRMVESVEVTFDSIPVPHLDPYDIARLVTDEFNNAFRMAQYSIPLLVGQNMSVGYLNRVSRRPVKLRRR